MADGIRHDRAGISRRGLMACGVALSATGLAGPARATSPTDPRLRTYEGKYVIDGHKIVDGYFAVPRGRAALDVLLVIPGAGGLDDSVRDTVRRHALAGAFVLAPDLAKTSGMPLASREAMIADVVVHAPRLKRHGRGNGTVRIVAA